jgi:energy-coupling factor transporter ATP-binding protein EcfA2
MPNEPSAPTPPDDRSGPVAQIFRWLLIVASQAPPGALVVLQEKIKLGPGLLVTAIVVYEAVLLVFAIVTKVWRKLEADWVNWLAATIKARLGWIGYRRRYLKHVFYCHRSFDVKGLTTQGIYTLELEHVFVELTIKPSPIHDVSADPIRPVPEELRGKRQIWDFLTSEALEQQQLAVIGAPGSGKTTLLKKIALTLVKRRRHKEKRVRRLKHRLPVLLFLRDLGKASDDSETYTLAQAVTDSLARRQGPVPPCGWIDYQLSKGRFLVLLDGLDEVADPEIRRKVATWVETQMQANAGNRFVVTSRPYGYKSNPLTGVTLLEVQSFSRDQVQSFVESWYRANEIMGFGRDDPGVEMTAREGAEDLLRRLLGTPTLSALAVNPLLLTMIATVHRYRSSLPGRRVELYDEICEVFLGKRRQARGLDTDLAPSQKQLVLQALAYHLMITNRREIPVAEAAEVIAEPLIGIIGADSGVTAESFLEIIEQTSGMLLEREKGIYGFAHLAFQEHLASAHIREQRLEQDMANRVGDPWWHEVIRLYGAKGDASLIIAACLKTDPMSPKALALAIDCIEEARSVNLELRKRLDRLMEDGVEDENPEIRKVVAEAMLTRRLQRMIRIDDTTSYDPSYMTNAEYQLFIDEKRASGEYHQPDHWHGCEFPERQGTLPVVGMRPSDAAAFCEWLSEWEVSSVKYRLPRPGELLWTDVDISGKTGGAEGHWTRNKDGCFLRGIIQIDQDRITLRSSVISDRFHRDISRALTINLAIDIDRVLSLTLMLVNDLTLIRNLGIALDLARARALAIARGFKCEFPYDSSKQRVVFAGGLNLDFAVDLARALASESTRTHKAAFDLAVSLTILKLRREGKLEAFEGIRIVADKITDDSDPTA